MQNKKSKILVTGGIGYIGSHTAVALIEQNYEVIIVDNLSNSHLFILDRIEQISGVRPKYYNMDVCDAVQMDKLFAENSDISGVIHFAAYKAVGESVAEPLKYYHNNLGGLVTLIQSMQKHQVKNLVFSSSCSVYGNATQLPVDENCPLQPAESPYGNTKRICEEILVDTTKTGTINAIALRYFNPIGAHESGLIGELPIGQPSNLIPVITQTAAGLRDMITVFGSDYNTPDGTCIRDYIHVVDIADAHVAAVERMLNNKQLYTYELYNLGTGEGVSVKHAINTFEATTGVKANHQYGPRRDGDVIQIWADCTKSNKELGWKTKLSLADAMISAWKWQQEILKLGL
ncbi:MAG: UDP-glucose 4-epimerase GalE [Bacteroidota bacterium]|nr:UDP-glucose 4-epimerase GalE [Bacteroidota bacterium]